MQDDTRKLLGECDAGIQMAIGSIDEVLPAVESAELRRTLSACKQTHERLRGQTQSLLRKYEGEGKAPNPMAKSMSWVKTNLKLAFQPGDQSIADLMVDGCNMGVKSLHRYANRYPNAAAEVHLLVGDLIDEEENLTHDLESYL